MILSVKGMGDPLVMTHGNLRIVHEPGPGMSGLDGILPDKIIFKSDGQRELNELRAAIESLNGDVERDIGPGASGADQTWRTTWRAFRDEFNAFYADHYDQIFGWGGTYDTCQDYYRPKLKAFSAEFANRGGQQTGPDIPPPSVKPISLLPDALATLGIPKWAPAAALIGVGLFLAAPYVMPLIAARTARAAVRTNPRHKRRRRR